MHILIVVAFAAASSIQLRATSCVMMAGLYDPKPGDYEDRRASYERYLKQCGDWHPDACYRAAMLYTGRTDSTKSDPKELLTRACRNGSDRACLELEVRELDPLVCQLAGAFNAQTTTQARVDALYRALSPKLEAACEHGEAPACLYLNRFSFLDRRKDLQAARLRWLTKACDINPAMGCYSLADLQITREIGDPDKALERAGRAGVASAYGKLGDRLASRRDVASIERAARFHRLACIGGWGESCERLGTMPDADGAKPIDPVEATNWLKLACERQSLNGCRLYGIRVRDGLGTPADPDVALRLFISSCGYDPQSCVEAGLLSEDERTRQDDPNTTRARVAVGLYEKGCDYLYPSACFHFARLFDVSSRYHSPFERLNAMDWACHGEDPEVAYRCFTVATWLARIPTQYPQADRIQGYMETACKRSTEADTFHSAACAHPKQ